MILPRLPSPGVFPEAPCFFFFFLVPFLAALNGFGRKENRNLLLEFLLDPYEDHRFSPCLSFPIDVLVEVRSNLGGRTRNRAEPRSLKLLGFPKPKVVVVVW